MTIEFEPETEYPGEEAWGEFFRRGRRRTPAPSVPRGVNYRPQPAPQSFVTKQEFMTITERIDRDAAATRQGIQTLSGRIDTLATAQQAEIAKLRRDFQQSGQLGLLLPLLTQPRSATLAEAQTANARVLIGDRDSFTLLLPLLLMGGLTPGGTTAPGGTTGAQDNSMMFLAMALMAGRR